MNQNSNRKMSTKTLRRVYSMPGPCQKQVTKRGHGVRDRLDGDRLKINLGQMVARLSVGGKVKACEQIAGQLSVLAGLSNDHSWGWRYVASVISGTISPSKKFMRVFALLEQNISPRQKQWFYFARRRSVAAIYDKSLLQEMIGMHMKELGYKPVSFSRYAQLKRRRV